MKLIIAIIRPEQLEAVQSAVDEVGACLASISQVGDGEHLFGSYRGAEFRMPQPRLRLEIVLVNEMLVRAVVEEIARAGTIDAPIRRGNGSIFVLPLDEYHPIVRAGNDEVMRPVNSFVKPSTQRIHNLTSGLYNHLRRFILAIIALAISAPAILVSAQNAGGDKQPQASQASSGVAVAGKTDRQGDNSKADERKVDDQPLTERERLLLERLDKLEQRLAELESRPRGNAETVVATDSHANEPSSLPVDGAKGAGEAKAAGIPVNPTQLSGLNGILLQGDQSKKKEPFAFADFTWLTGNPRTKDTPLETKYFTGEFRADVAYHQDFNHPHDDTISGSSEVFRSNEVQLTHLGIGGDFHIDNVRGRFMTQLGMYSQTQPRNDSSPARGQWNLDNAYRYLTEAYGGYHFDRMNGINVDAGIFLSYIGLWSFYNFDNWTYQPSFVSSNTPWFFTGVRVQIYPSEKLKIEPWFINGWQTYGKFNKAPGIGGQVLWRPNDKLSLVLNNYWGQDTLGIPGRKRIHTDDSIQFKYFDQPDGRLSKAAFSITIDAGCEYGGGTSCRAGNPSSPKQYFLGFMAYNRFWFLHDRFGLTIGGGAITNPGRYLVLLPPINGATAFSGTPYFTANPGDQFRGADGSITFDYMPSQYITWRLEYDHRTSNVPYYSGPGGVTPPGGNTGAPGSFVPGWTPDLRKFERRLTFAILVKM